MKIKKAIAGILAILMVAVPFMGTAFAAVVSGNGNARHGTDYANYSINRVSNYYWDQSENKWQNKDKESVVISIGAGSTDRNILGKTATYLADVSNVYPLSFSINTGNELGNSAYAMITSSAPALRLEGAAGYDAAVLGTKELLLGDNALAAMLNGAVLSRNNVPYLSIANVSTSGNLSNAFKNYSIGQYSLINKYGTKVAIIGIVDSDELKDSDQMKLSDGEETAKSVAADIRESEGEDTVIVCVVNGSENAASKYTSIDDIDLVVCGEKLALDNSDEKLVGEATDGSVTQVIFKKTNDGYAIDKTTAVDITKYGGNAAVNSVANVLADEYNSEYFEKFGYTYEQTLTRNGASYTMDELKSAEADYGMANLITDAYISASGSRARISALSTKSLSSAFSEGTLRVSNVYDAFGGDNYMVTFYLNGEELLRLTEMASDLNKKDDENRLYFSGITYTYNPHRIPGNRVYDLKVDGNDVEKETLYAIVSDKTTADEIRTMSAQSGVFPGKVVFKNANGEESEEHTAVKGNSGNMRAWECLARRLRTYGGSGIPAGYSNPDGRVNYDTSMSPKHLFTQINKVFVFVIVAIFVVIAIAILIIFGIRRFIKGGSISDALKPSSKSRRNEYRVANSGKRYKIPKKSKNRNLFTQKKRRRKW